MNMTTYPLELSGSWFFHAPLNAWVLENAVYCANAICPALQCLTVYVPAPYLTAEGACIPSAACGRYTAASAPVVFDNTVGGYSESSPYSPGFPLLHAEPYLSRGMVYVSVGARGRQTQVDGVFVGKSPAALVDLKAAVRFLKHNRAVLPGDYDRIISVGVSAGGALSSLLGVTGNSANYTAALRQIGAAMDVTDDVFAAQCYCPIIDLPHADAGYEWMFRDLPEYTGFAVFPAGTLTGFRKALSDGLARRYVTYFNSLGLKHPVTGAPLTLSETGHGGSAYDYLMDALRRAAGKYLSLLDAHQLPVDYSVQDYLSGSYTYLAPLPPKGPMTPPSPNCPPPPPEMGEFKGLDKRGWLTWDGESASITSLRDMTLCGYAAHMKPCPAFDDLDLLQPENEELGSAANSFTHFSPNVAECISSLSGTYPEDAAQYLAAYQNVLHDEALSRRCYLLNPLNYVGTEEIADRADHFRIRVGAQDAATSFTTAMLLALKLENAGHPDVDYAMVWEWGHGDADYPGELCDWIEAL